MYNFDEKNLVVQLAATTQIAKTGFALSVATRLLPMYVEYTKMAKIELNSLPSSCVGTLWDIAISARIHQMDEVETASNTLLNLMPGDNDPWNEYHPLAEDAIAAIVYALRSYLTNDPQEAAWAARRSYEAADQFAIRQLDIDFQDKGVEHTLLSHPIVQQELMRQNRDLELAIIGDIGTLRAISATESLLVLGK